MVGPGTEAPLLRRLRPQRHHVGHRRPQGTDVTAAGSPVSLPVLQGCSVCFSCLNHGSGRGGEGRQVEVDPGAISGTFSLPHHLLMRVKKKQSKKTVCTHTQMLSGSNPHGSCCAAGSISSASQTSSESREATVKLTGPESEDLKINSLRCTNKLQSLFFLVRTVIGK